ncbi:response regulator [Thermodesulfobacteriota bacterium]
MRNNNILLVDDEESILNSFRKILHHDGYHVTTASSGEEAVTALHSSPYDLVISDLVMAGMNGIQVLKEAKKIDQGIGVIILTGYGDMTTAINALRLGADDYLLKPCDSDELLLRLSRCLEKRNLLLQLKDQNRKLSNEIIKCQRVEEALQESDATLEGILMAAPIGIGMLHNQVFLWVSAQVQAMLGYLGDDLTGKSVSILYENDEEYHRTEPEKLPALDEQGTREVETRWVCKDGGVIHILLRLTPVIPLDISAGIIFAATNITERKRYESALKKSSEKIKLFAYSVAHDLKSPAIAIHGLTKLLNKRFKDILPEKEWQFCKQIMKSSEQITTLADKINIYISTRESPLQLESIKLKELSGIIREEFAPQLNDRQIRWSEPECLPTIKADRIALSRVLRNLVENALKYGGDELHTIVISYKETLESHVLAVKDDGIGLANEDCKKIFQLFERHKTSHGTEGAGLGLAIVKEIAEQHQGEVWAEPDSEKGITFYVAVAKDL